MKYGVYIILDKSNREQFISEIKNSPQLPERFYEIYSAMYPNSLTPNSWMHEINHEADTDSKSYCVCREAFYAGLYPSYVNSVEMMLVTNHAEQNVSQRECLNYYIKKKARWFKGHILYKIEEKSDSEIVEIILLLENSSLYDKDRNPRVVNDKVNEILNKLNN
jgi:hypothetical protein